MGRLISIPIFVLPYIFLLSFNLFGENLGALVVTPIIQKACDLSNVRDFCYYVLGSDPSAEFAHLKFNIEDIAVQAAYANYSNIHRKVWTITSNETNSEFRQLYRKCLHEYNLMKPIFDDLRDTLVFKGDLEKPALDISYHASNCVIYFMRSPNIPNPIDKDNFDILYFVELIRSIYYAPLSS
ncbi:hypothetical protein FXO38_06149 [Capsicum annuum]|nr:hypothetical protein FXO37_31878 [Capsicum annuum]KAF3672351.1 hypothetical protein FXO38_06149 [Capsicum annuum]